MKFDNANNYTIAGPGRVTLETFLGPTTIEVVNGSHTIAAPMTLANDAVMNIASAASVLTISGDASAAGKAITKQGPGTLEMKHVRAGSLTVNAGTVRVLAKPQANDATGTSVVSALSIASGAVLDLTNNSAIIDYAGAVGTQVSDLRQHLQSGRLTTSSATGARRLGYGDNAVLGRTSFAGQSVDASSILIKYTYAGDGNLDGQVDITDLGNLATSWQTSNVWTGGDFDYNNFVDITDLGMLATNWQAGVGSPLRPESLMEALGSFGLTASVVPEPSIVSLSLASSTLLLAATRRSRPRSRSVYAIARRNRCAL
jgi:hypothetical protein